MLPLAWIPFQVARCVWLLVNVLLILVSCLMLGLTYLPRERVAPLLVYYLVMSFFSPMLLAILTGQITFLVVFGVAASLFLIKRERWFWAGAALILTSVKPHLVILVGPYLMFYMAVRRKWAGWLGLGVAGVTCLMILFILRPSWIVDFSALLDAPPTNWATPTIGGFLSFYGAGPWVRYIGTGFLLLLPLFLRQSEFISLETAVSVLILVTIPMTFFGWSYDQSLLLVPIAQIVGWLFGPLRSALGRWVLSVSMIVTVTVNMAQRAAAAKTRECYFFWVPLVWGVIYALASWMVGRSSDRRLRGSASGDLANLERREHQSTGDGAVVGLDGPEREPGLMEHICCNLCGADDAVELYPSTIKRPVPAVRIGLHRPTTGRPRYRRDLSGS
jgi:hypothetical protein